MKESKELKERKEISKIRKDFLLLEHDLKMERLRYERKSTEVFHDLALQRERIKSAEIRKSQERKFQY